MFFRLFGSRHIHLGDDLGAYASRAHQRTQERFDALHIVVLEAVDEVELLLADGDIVLATGGGEQAALLIDHRHLARFELRNAGGDEIDDGLYLFLLEAAAGLQLHEHGGAGGMVIPDEGGLARHGQVDAGSFDRAKVGNGAAEFRLQSVLVTGVLHELADAEARILVHGRKSAAAFRQALSGELQPCIADALGRNFDCVGARLDPVGNLRGIQRLGDLRLIPGSQVRVQETETGTA